MGNVIDLQRYREKKANPLSDLIAYLAKWKGGGGDILSILHDTMATFASTGSRDYDHLLGYVIVPDLDAGTITMKMTSAIGNDPARSFIDIVYHHGEVRYPSPIAPDAHIRVGRLLSYFTEGGELVTWPYATVLHALIHHLDVAGWIPIGAQQEERHGSNSAVLVNWIHPDQNRTLSLTVDMAVPYTDNASFITSEDNTE